MSSVPRGVPLEQASAHDTHIEAGYVPSGFAGELAWQVRELGGLQVALPAPTPAQLQALAQHVRSQADTARLSLAQTIAQIDQVVHRLLDAHNPQRQALNHWLARSTGLDAELLRLGLNRYLQCFRAPQLQRFVVEDLGNPALLDGFEPRAKGGLSLAQGPGLLMHVWAGNVPGLPLWSLVAGLLVKAGNLAKLPSAEPLVASLFARLLAQASPQLAQALAVVWWPGGDVAREEAALTQADVVLAYGGPSSLHALRALTPLTTRFLAFGHKLSFGMVDAAALDQRRVHEVARAAALDVVRFEQQGCYSPQLFYVASGGACSPLDFAHHLQQQLRALSVQYPRRALYVAERQALAQWRAAQEGAALAGAPVQILGDVQDPFCVVYAQGPEPLQPSALNRTVRVVAVPTLGDALATLQPHRHLLQTVGVAAAPQALWRLSQALARCGVTRICAIGSMTLPEAGWHHDGRFNLADLVQMVDIELSAEHAADSLAPYHINPA